MSTHVTDANGQPAPDVAWGDSDLSSIDLTKYEPRDWNAVTTRNGFTGPRYVRHGADGIGDVETCKPVMPKYTGPVQTMADDNQLHLSAHHH